MPIPSNRTNSYSESQARLTLKCRGSVQDNRVHDGEYIDTKESVIEYSLAKGEVKSV